MAVALIILGGCVSYQPRTPYPPTSDAQQARRACGAEQQTRMTHVPIIDLMRYDEIQGGFARCMRAHGWERT